MEPLNDVVVVVDDEPNYRDTLIFVLEAQGFPTVSASDGIEGLEALRFHRPKVVVVDASMPRMDGYQFVREVRSDRHLRDVFVLFITGSTEHDAQLKAMGAGADAYMTKPIDHDELLALVGARFEDRRREEDRPTRPR